MDRSATNANVWDTLKANVGKSMENLKTGRATATKRGAIQLSSSN